jgi:hypothetical protein
VGFSEQTYGRGACVRRQSIAIRAIITVTPELSCSVESFFLVGVLFLLD